MSSNPVKDVIIIGGGTAGWMAAAAISKFLGNTVSIKLIESDQIGTVGVGEATIPQIKIINAALGIDEADFMSKTGGTFKLGIEFIDWLKPDHSYLHSFGSIGYNLSQLPFHHHWLRSRANGNKTALWDYCLNAAAARDNKFSPMTKVGSSPLPGIAYAYHFDASLYAKFLRHHAEQNGAVRIEGKVVDTKQREDGFIESVVMEDGRIIKGDLFIDCSGFQAVLIEKALKTGYVDWNHWLPCDRAMPMPSSNDVSTNGEPIPIRPYTQSIAHKAGWQWRIPLQHRTGNGHVYSSAYMEDDEAADILMANLEGEALAEPRVIRYTTGRRQKFWNKNVVTIGLASGFLEPLESTSIHLIQSAISRLINFFPNAGFASADRDEYNRQMILEFERVRDFIILHYHANERTDSDFWKDCRNMSVPDSLTEKIALFRANGRLYTREEDLFADTNWLQVMMGQGIEPEGYHPMADTLEPEKLEEFLGNVRSIITQASAHLPSHTDYIKSHCAAVDPV